MGFSTSRFNSSERRANFSRFLEQGVKGIGDWDITYAYWDELTLRQFCRVCDSTGKRHSIMFSICLDAIMFGDEVEAFHKALDKAIKLQDAEVETRESQIGKGYW